MSVVVWDGKVLASDTCTWSEGARRAVQKLYYIPDFRGEAFLTGFVGDGTFAIVMASYLAHDTEKPEHSKFDVKPNHQCGLVIKADNSVWTLSTQGVIAPTLESKYAIGAGQEFAWGALEAYATAEHAVEIVMRRSDYAGFKIDTLSFNDKPEVLAKRVPPKIVL